MADNTPKITREIPYRYTCEHCGTITEWKTANVTGDSNANINASVIPEAMEQAKKGNFFNLNNINGKCDSCGKHQSWELGEAKAWMVRSPLMGLGLGGMIGGVGAFMTAFFFGLLGALVIFLIIAFLGMVGAFIYGLIKYIIVKTDMNKTHVRYAPEVIWNAKQPSETQFYPQAEDIIDLPAPSSAPVMLPAPQLSQLAPPSVAPVIPAYAQQPAPAAEAQYVPQYATQPQMAVATVVGNSFSTATTCPRCGTPSFENGAYCMTCGSRII